MPRDPYTDAIHADAGMIELPDVAPPLRPTTTFRREPGGPIYRRDGPPTVSRLEAVLGALEGGAAVFYPSGLGALASLLRVLRPARVTVPAVVYHGTRSFVELEAKRGLWEIAPESALRDGDVLLIETPANPTCLITDVAARSTEMSDRGVVTVVDSTFGTPVLQQPLELGADFVMHATTKFIGGHSDAMGGFVASRNTEVIDALLEQRHYDGMVPGELEAWLTLRGIRTLPLRVHRQSETAMAIAGWLVDRVRVVWYPGLESHPGHDVATRQMEAFGGVLSFEVEGAEAAAAVVDRLRLFRNATSLGGVESLAEHRILSDSTAPPGLIRLSIGLESPGALITDLDQALS